LVGRSHSAEKSFLQADNGAENTKEKSRAVLLYVSTPDEPLKLEN
jgi:hypothetical protein